MQRRQAIAMEKKRDESNSETGKISGGLRISRTTLPDDHSVSSSPDKNNKEDHFLKVLNEQSRELSMVINLEGKIKYCNQAIKKLLGYDASRLIGNNVREIIQVQHWVAFRAALRASEEESEVPIYIDCSFIDYDNKRHNFSLSVIDKRHHPLIEGYIINAHKINRVKKLEQKLSLRDLAVETIRDAVIIVDPFKKKFLFANQAFYELSGFSRSDVMGGKLDLFKAPYSEMLFDQKTDAKEIERFGKALKKRKKFEGRIFSKRKNGEVFYNRFSLSPVIDHNDRIQYYVATSREIKSRKK